MRTFRFVALLAALACIGVAQSTVHVKPYETKTGKQVQGHDRTAPDKTQKNNWSTKGNVNPETGKPGNKTAKK